MTTEEPNIVETIALNEQPAPAGRTLLLLVLAFVAGIVVTERINQRGGNRMTAFLRAESTAVKAKQNGFIKTIKAPTGTQLHASSAVAEMANESLELRIIVAQQEVARRKSELEQTRAMAEVDLSWRLKELETETLNTQLKSATLLQGKHTLEMENAAWRDFVDKFDGLTSRDETGDLLPSLMYPSSMTADESRIRAILRQEAARNAIEVSDAQIELCDSRLSELKELKSNLPERVRQAIGIEVAQARLDQAAELLKRLERQAEQLTMNTPAYGTVGRFHKDVGDAVAAGETIVEIFDEDRLYLEAHIPSRDVPQYEHGMTVGLRFPGDQERTGRIVGIPAESHAVQNSTDAINSADSIITLRIEPSGALWPKAPIGSAIEVIAED